MKARILVVDNTPALVRLLTDILSAEGYDVSTASSGSECMDRLGAEAPDLVLLDIEMETRTTGFEVCRQIRSDPSLVALPVVMMTAGTSEEVSVKGLDAGADDFVTKPFNEPELLARVRSLLRVKRYHSEMQSQARALAELNRDLEQRANQKAAELERVNDLKRFFSPQVVTRLTAGGVDELLKIHRKNVVALFLELRGFAKLEFQAQPEDTMRVLREYHAAMGQLILKHGGTIERFTGDGIRVLFNAPEEVAQPAARAARLALDISAECNKLSSEWRKLGFRLSTGIGVAQGVASVGAIGFEGRREYSVIGPVCSIASRLCMEAKSGQILVDQRAMGEIEQEFDAELVGDVDLLEFADLQTVYCLVGEKKADGRSGVAD